MKIPQHDQADRIRIAQVAGALQNLAGRVNRGELTDEQAVGELHGITRDRHLLAHGLGDPAGWPASAVPVRLAVAAGVDLDEAAALHAEMHPPGARGMRLGRPE